MKYDIAIIGGGPAGYTAHPVIVLGKFDFRHRF